MSERVRLQSAWLALTLAFSGGAWATGSSDIDVIQTVTRNLDSVTYSTAALPTYASYGVKLAHYASRNELIKPVYFEASTKVVDAGNAASATLSAPFLASALPAGCVIGDAPTKVKCSFPNGMYYKTDKIEFALTVSAPLAPSTPVAGYKVILTSTASWTECENRYRVQTGPTSTTLLPLDAPNPLNVSTLVLPAGGTVYTGTNAGIPAPSTDSTWAAKVVVPPTANSVATSISNVVDPMGATTACPRASNLKDCSSSTMTVPGIFSNLVITLRRDASTIDRYSYSKINSAIIYYDKPGIPSTSPPINYEGYAFQLPSCSDTSTYGGALPKIGIPCIQTRTAVYAPRTTRDRDSDCDPYDKKKKLLYWEFVILAVDNGRFTN